MKSRIAAILAAAGVFYAQAYAAPFGSSATASSETGTTSLVASLFNATAGLFGAEMKSEDPEESLILRYYPKTEGCPASSEEEEAIPEEEEKEARKPSGPEPIYFGF